MIFECLQGLLQSLTVDFQPIFLPLDLDSESLIARTRSVLFFKNLIMLWRVLMKMLDFMFSTLHCRELCDLVCGSLTGCRLASQVSIKQLKGSLKSIILVSVWLLWYREGWCFGSGMFRGNTAYLRSILLHFI